MKTNFVHCVYVVEKYSEEPTSTREESAPLLNWIFNSVGHDFLGRAEPRLRTDVFFMTE